MRCRRRRESAMDQIEQRQRRPRTQAQRRWRRRVHAGGRETHQATTLHYRCARYVGGSAAAQPLAHGPPVHAAAGTATHILRFP
eukprot:gene24904-biopygen23935